ncbi:MAG: hypothetical protein ACXVJE_11640 [Mucilaginibacter sp.]
MKSAFKSNRLKCIAVSTVIILAATAAFTQESVAQGMNRQKADSLHNDLLKRDSAKIALLKKQYLQQDSAKLADFRSTTARPALIKSPQFEICASSKVPGQPKLQLSLQIIRFMNAWYLNWIVNTGLTSVVTLGKDSKLQMVLDDRSVVVLYAVDGTARHLAGSQNLSELSVVYRLPVASQLTLLSKKVTSVQLAYDGGILTFPVNKDGALKMMKAFASIQ